MYALFGRFGDGDDDDCPGRILTAGEFAARVAQRPDIFEIDHQQRLHYLTIAAFVAAGGMGTWMHTMADLGTIGPDWVDSHGQTAASGRLLPTLVERPHEQNSPQPAPTREHIRQRLTSSPSHPHQFGHAIINGDPRARVANQGVIYWASAAIRGRSLPGTDPDGPGGFAKGLEAVLAGPHGFARSGSTGDGRRLAGTIGFGPGYGGAPGGDGNSVDQLIADLAQPPSGEVMQLRHRAIRQDLTPVSGGIGKALVEGRSRTEIARVVNQNLGALRYAYTSRLRLNPSLGGKITVRFAVDEFGRVVACTVLQSNLGDSYLERVVVEKIRAWRFDKLDKPGDITEVVYPFVFSR